MPYSVEGKLVVAISSRALFDFEEENRVFDRDGEGAYIDLQFARLDVPAREGVAFPLVKKLLAFNTPKAQRVEVVILSKNDPVSGLRVFKSAKGAGLSVERGVFTRGRNPYKYLDALKANLFLSANETDVMSALEANCPAARVYPESAQAASRHADEVRIAFDGDAVLFSDEAERVYQQDGLEAFTQHEAANVFQPLPPGPFKPLLEALHRLQAAAGNDVPLKIRTALVTARSAPAHERAIRTLMGWNIAVDEAMFLGGLDKGAFLKAFEPDFYFDDQPGHIDSARAHVAAGHVPFGVANIR
jgi:5'-nucleotidase